MQESKQRCVEVTKWKGKRKGKRHPSVQRKFPFFFYLLLSGSFRDFTIKQILQKQTILHKSLNENLNHIL